MKKLLFGLIATVMFGFVSNAQEVSQKYAREYAAKFMVEFKNSVYTEYSSSRNFEDFIKNTTGPYNPQGPMTTQGLEMLRVAYGFLTKKTSDEEIIRSYSGIEVAKAFKWLRDNPSKDEGSLFGITSENKVNIGGKGGPSFNIENVVFANNSNLKCCFFCLRCHLTTIFGEEGADTIIDAVVDFIIGLLKK